MIDKNQAIIDYLVTCPTIENSPLYFNFINAKDNTHQILTTAEDRIFGTSYVDGSVSRQYTFTIVTFQSITENAIIKDPNYQNENVEDLQSVQALIDWIAEQSDNNNYPDFGTGYVVEDISTTTAVPKLDGVNTEVTPQLAMYSVDIVVDYLDTTKMIWS